MKQQRPAEKPDWSRARLASVSGVPSAPSLLSGSKTLNGVFFFVDLIAIVNGYECGEVMVNCAVCAYFMVSSWQNNNYQVINIG